MSLEKFLMVTLLYAFAMLIGLIALVVLSRFFPFLPAWVGLVMGVIIVIPVAVVAWKIMYS